MDLVRFGKYKKSVNFVCLFLNDFRILRYRPYIFVLCDFSGLGLGIQLENQIIR